MFQASGQTSRTWAAAHDVGFRPSLLNSCLVVVVFLALQRLWSLAGWHSSMEYVDILHTVWLGTGRDAVGSLLLEAVELHECFSQVGENWNERLEKIVVVARSWCRQHHLDPSSLEELSGLVHKGRVALSAACKMALGKVWRSCMSMHFRLTSPRLRKGVRQSLDET